MINNNKILTVSYGTFSCTLEGFDDSFGTMKAIAEYFRDLAADDRYFGAEPPQPDAEMLARIAEREIARRVEAREQDGGIVLRAGNGAPAALGVAVADSAAPQPAPQPEEHAAPVAEKPAAQEPVADESAADEDSAQPDAAQDDTDGMIAALTEQDAPEAAIAEEVIEDAPEPDTETAAETESEADEPVAEDVEPAVADLPADDSIAAKLQRIRAVVSSAESAGVSAYSEDEHADDFTLDSDGDGESDAHEALTEALSETLEDAPGQDDQADAEADDQGCEDEMEEDEDISSILAGLGSEEPEAPAEQHAAPEMIDADEDDFEQPAAYDEDDSDALEDDLGADLDDLAASFDDEDETPAADAPRARVIKVKRADLEAAIAAGDLEEVYDEDAEDAPASSLSDEDEADLMRELAEVEAEIATDADDSGEMGSDLDELGADQADAADAEIDAIAMPGTEAQEAADASAARLLEEAQGDEEDALNRLMAEADHMMDEPEGNDRRAAYSQLRAAAAATKADEALDPSAGGDETSAYRSDLEQAVKPRRPQAGGARSQRPGASRPAPLKLVAEQRIDAPGKRAAGPVRPRRISAATAVDTAPGDGDSFADYAASLGATELPDLLEAAASYLSFVEGRDQFSRPQLMTKVRQVFADEFSREDGLRSFGKLLRAGKIEKIKGGRFTVSEEIGFRPNERAAG